MKTYLIKTNGEYDENFIIPKGDSQKSLDVLQKAVGGYIEVVSPHKLERTKLYVNEEGKMHDFTANVIATGINGNVIVGDVVVQTSNAMVQQYIEKCFAILNMHPLGHKPINN